MVFYRKYRPQSIDELDSESVRNTLESVFKKEDSVPHAFLFTGSKGLGKTSTARIIAKVVNCTNRKKGSIEPCNKCDQCVSITNGSNLDILEIDGASNRGIDEVRDLREKIKLSPALAKKKVYIIDEVHMLTTEAFNALLKTLEEPPAHALFALCTTEPHKVPETILSRCFHISFQKATKEELIRSLSRIVKGEKLEVEKDALEYIASLSDGAFRDGAKILEEVSLLSNGKKISKELVENKYHVSGITYQVAGILDCLHQKKSMESLDIISKLIAQGADIKYFIDELILALHSQLLENVGGKQTLFNISEIKKLIQLLNEASLQTKFAVIPQLPLELVVVEWSQTDNGLTTQTKSEESKAEEKRPPEQKQVQNNDFWHQYVDQVKKDNNLVAGVLRSCSLGSFEKNTLKIDTRFKFHSDKLKDNINVLEQAARELTGKETIIAIQLTE